MPRCRTIWALRSAKRGCACRPKPHCARRCNCSRATQGRIIIWPWSTRPKNLPQWNWRAGTIRKPLPPVTREILSWRSVSRHGSNRRRPFHLLRQASHEFRLSTRGRALYEFTDQVQGWVRQNKLQTGLVTLHVRHTSASLLIQENADPDVRRDLESFFKRLVPDGDPLFVHTAEGEDDMPAHVRTALTAVNLSIPVSGGRPALGTWQGIYVWEHRHQPHTRRIAAHIFGE